MVFPNGMFITKSPGCFLAHSRCSIISVWWRNTRGRCILAIVHTDVVLIQLFPLGVTFCKDLTHLTIHTNMFPLYVKKTFIIYVIVLSHILCIYACILLCSVCQYILNHVYCYLSWNFMVFAWAILRTWDFYQFSYIQRYGATWKYFTFFKVHSGRQSTSYFSFEKLRKHVREWEGALAVG